MEKYTDDDVHFISVPMMVITKELRELIILLLLLIKLDNVTGEMIVWKNTDTMYPSEMVYVPRPGSKEEDDGVLLSVVLDVSADTRDFLMVLDAKNLKELGRAYVPRTVHLPPTIHGLFRRN